MALMKISIYRQQYFDKSSMPAINTLKKWIDNGKLVGKKIGTMYFIDPDKQDEIVPVNNLAAKVLQRHI